MLQDKQSLAASKQLAKLASAEVFDDTQPPFEHEGRMVRRLVEVRRDHVQQVNDVLFRYVEVDGGRELGTERVSMRWIYRYELEHMLVRTGFEPVSWSSGYDGRPYSAHGDIVVVARRT